MNFPPPDYVQTTSAVPGITVFMPRPQAEDQHEVVSFACPQCDATTAYSAENGGLTCTFCGFYEPPAQATVGRAAQEFEFTVETVERAAHGWGVERKELTCQRCGAHTTVSTDMLTHTCPFCGSNQVVQAKATQDVLRPRFLAPVTTTVDSCRQNTAVWLGSSWLLPDNLRQLARIAEFTPVFLPFWTFDAQATADWRAEVAHTRTKSAWHNGRRVTRTVVEWRWESGHVNQTFDDVLVNGSTRISPVLLSQLRSFDLNALTPYDPSFLAGIPAQAYDTGLEAAWEMGRHTMRQRTKTACQSQATSQRIRNFSMNLDFSAESWRYVLLPVYLSTYRYNGRSFQVMVHGQNGTVVGQRPVDWWKVALAGTGAILPGIALGLFALYLSSQASSLSDYQGMAALAAIVALVMALVFIAYTVRTALRMDDI